MGETQKKEKKKIGLTTKIFIALLAGAVFGIILCYAVPSGHIKDDIIVEGVLYVVGQGFIKLMKMLVVPLVFCSLVCGSMSIGDTKKLGTVGARTLIFYLATTATCGYRSIVCRKPDQSGCGTGHEHDQDQCSICRNYEGYFIDRHAVKYYPR